MNEQTAFYGVILRRFFNKFQNIIYQDVPICKYINYQFMYYSMNHWNLAWAKNNLPYLEDEMSRLPEEEIYNWSDEPYIYDPHPNGKILMRGGFGDIASLYLPKDRFILLSPNQAEVDVIKTNRPDLIAHNIEGYYRENPQAVESLNRQIAHTIHELADDPLLGSPDLLEWFKGKTPEIVRVLDAVQSLFDNHDIGAVLSISSIVWMDNALNLIAKANRIPSLTLQHGLILERDLFCHIPISATKKLVWGNATLAWYKKYGFPESRIKVVGSPRFDVIFNRQWCDKERLCQLVGIEPSKRILVYATGTEMNTIVPIVLNGIASIPDLYLVMLLHPSESSLFPQYQKMAEGFSNCTVIRHGQISLYDALSGADLFITHCSTAGLEAMLFNLPIITVEPSPPPFSYGDLGASIRVSNSAELNQVVNRLISDESFKKNSISQYRDFLSEYCIPDGLASKRLFDELELLCNTGGVY